MARSRQTITNTDRTNTIVLRIIVWSIRTFMQIRSLGYVLVCNLETYRIIRRDPALVPNRHIPSAPFVISNVGLSLFLALAPAELKGKRNRHRPSRYTINQTLFPHPFLLTHLSHQTYIPSVFFLRPGSFTTSILSSTNIPLLSLTIASPRYRKWGKKMT